MMAPKLPTTRAARDHKRRRMIRRLKDAGIGLLVTVVVIIVLAIGGGLDHP